MLLLLSTTLRKPALTVTSSEKVIVTLLGADWSRELSAGSLPTTVACASAGVAPLIASTAQAPSSARTAKIRLRAFDEGAVGAERTVTLLILTRPRGLNQP